MKIVLWILIPVIILLFAGALIAGLIIGLKQVDHSQEPRRRPFQWKKAERKGSVGEEQVEEFLKSCMIAGDKLLSEVKLPNGKDGDIDHILLSTRGFFVIETKNWSGDIYGDEKSENWTLVFDDGDSIKRYSPFKQNSGHIYALKKIFDLRVWFENVIIFVQANKQHVQSFCVYTMAEFQARLNSLNGVAIRSESERDELYALLRKYAKYIFYSPQLQETLER